MEPVAVTEPQPEPFYAAEPVAADPAEEPVLFVEPAVHVDAEPEPIEVGARRGAGARAVRGRAGHGPASARGRVGVGVPLRLAARGRARRADEHLSEFRAAWSPAETARRRALRRRAHPHPVQSDEPVEDEPNVPWFVADVQEPAPKAEEPSPSKTDTWSGRALGS